MIMGCSKGDVLVSAGTYYLAASYQSHCMKCNPCFDNSSTPIGSNAKYPNNLNTT